MNEEEYDYGLWWLAENILNDETDKFSRVFSIITPFTDCPAKHFEHYMKVREILKTLKQYLLSVK